jgi:hypothetical protein
VTAAQDASFPQDPGPGAAGPHRAPGSGLPTSRFWAKVEKTDTCWLWTGATQTNGYGRVAWDGKVPLAHRVSYELENGPVPDGLHLDHLCRVRNCVRPDHLEPVPQRTNTLRGTGLTAVNARKTHCVRGHEFTPENTGSRPDRPQRICRACKRLQNAARPPRTKAA